MIPFTDLYAQYESIKDEIDSAIKECITDSNFIKGKAVADFESAFAKYIGADHCIGCGNGTDALEIILKSLNIGRGDEVIVPALTWIASAEAVNNVGAEPVFADINPKNFTIDINRFEEKITKRTRAIIPVHLYGCPADMNEILAIARQHKLFVIEDCAQAHGAEYYGRKVGTFGVAAAFSFFPSKNLGAFGDAGAIVTNNAELANSARQIANHGQLNNKHRHLVVGRNSRLDSLQASILSVKLKFLDEWNSKRRNTASSYIARLKVSAGLQVPLSEDNKKHVFHLFVIRCKNRNAMIELLNEKNIAWGIHYPKAIPFLDAYAYKQHKTFDFKFAGILTEEILSIPIYPEISEEHVNAICDQLLKYQ
jgi:dTDP-4-amino-4,6-dideoxygalactose transaminase